ncbi:MAG: amidohydrolase family protein [Gammaproteobacteria bacterium]
MWNNHFVFSADAHIMEPGDLFTGNLPQKLRSRGVVTEREGDYIITRAGDLLLERLRRPVSIGDMDGREKRGVRDLRGRLADMELDGVDAELLFPSLAIATFKISDVELERETAKVYNDWLIDHVRDHRDKLVPNAVLPVHDFKETVAELTRVAKLGYKSVMLPCWMPEGVPEYNSEEWDPVFEHAGELGLVFAMHTGTGLDRVVRERGPGGAIINYSSQMLDAQHSIMYMVAGGVLDRHPKAAVAAIECGASWLGALAERMDEVNAAHHMFVRPKLSRKPSEIIAQQVKATFQTDRECVIARRITGHQAVMWGADYPHAEGTFPDSRTVLNGIFQGVDISDDEVADIVGRTAARFFGLRNPALAA